MKKLIKFLSGKYYIAILIALTSAILLVLPVDERNIFALILAVILLAFSISFLLLDILWIRGILIKREEFDSFGVKHLVADRIYPLRRSADSRIIYTPGGTTSRIPLRSDKSIYLLASFYGALVKNLFPKGKIPGKVLVLGGAGCSIPHKLVTDGATTKVTTVELCPEMIRVARQYFLAGVEEEIELVCADAREFVERDRGDGEYDFIFSDIFLGDDTPLEEYTGSYIQNLHRLLSDAGMLYINLGWKDRRAISAAVDSIRQTFNEVHIILSGKQFFAITAKPGKFAEHLKSEVIKLPSYLMDLKK